MGRYSVVLALVGGLSLVGCGGGGSHYFGPDPFGDAGGQPRMDASAPDAGGGGCKADAQCGGATSRCNTMTGRCVPCLPQNDNCPMGSHCVESGGTFSCNSMCRNAADCPRAMGGNPEDCCAAVCIDTASDPKNCNGCGVVCGPYSNASAACNKGSCGIGICAMGFGDCDGNLGNGCETMVGNDVNNCGGCGKPCNLAHATASCAAGACAIAGCDNGFGDCDSNAQDGCEAMLNGINNCGACGKTCPAPANASPACVGNGQCGIGQCNQGFGDCNGNVQDGCERNLQSDVNNCGACARVCALPNALAGCSGGACKVQSCNFGFGDCDGNAQNGCESTLATDARNCGACGKVCPVNMPTCTNGQCNNTKFQFKLSQTIDGHTVICSAVNNANVLYTECDDLRDSTAGGLYFANMVQCGPAWSMQPAPGTDFAGFCQALTGTAKWEVYWSCNNSQLRATWKARVWGTTMDNGYMQNVRCYY